MNRCAFNVINFDTIDSTSTYLKRSYSKYNDLTLVYALSQSEGHGRMKREWVSPYGESLLFSLLIKNKNIIENFSSLSLMTAVAIYNFLKRYVSNVSIKWPNDVYVNDKKIAGILLESISYDDNIEALVVGVGININIKEFPSHLIDKATSLGLETNEKYDISALKPYLEAELSNMILNILSFKKSYLEVIRHNNYLKDKTVKAYIDNELQEVKVIDINDDNSLRVIKDNKIYNLNVGEVIPIN